MDKTATTLWDRSIRKIGMIQKTLHRWSKAKIANPISKIDGCVKHIFREPNSEADYWATVGAEAWRKVVIHRKSNADIWKAVKGFWDGRRKDGTTMTPAHRGRAASGQASCSLIQSAAVSACCQLWFIEKGHLCGIPLPLSPSRRVPSTATPRGRPPRRRNVTTPACCGRVALGQGSLYCTWSRGPDRAHGTICSAFAESSRSCGTTLHRCSRYSLNPHSC